MRATIVRDKVVGLIERAAAGARGHTVTAILVGALVAQQTTVALTGDEADAGDIAPPTSADGGRPGFLEMPRTLPGAVEADRSVRDRARRYGEGSTLKSSGVPAVRGVPGSVLRAYRAAAARMEHENPGCGLTVPLLAAIGRVESNHAAGGNVNESGRTLAPIIGVRLDGSPGVAVIRDTDGGRYDGDSSYDRAVGPMQFIPSTWARWASDGNRDGTADPHNAFDASLSAGRYLCASGDLSGDAGIRRAILSYNHSEEYVLIVLSWMQVYAGGTTAVPDRRRSSSAIVRVASPSDGRTESGSATSRDARRDGSGDGAKPASRDDSGVSSGRRPSDSAPKKKDGGGGKSDDPSEDSPLDAPESPLDLPDLPGAIP